MEVQVCVISKQLYMSLSIIKLGGFPLAEWNGTSLLGATHLAITARAVTYEKSMTNSSVCSSPQMLTTELQRPLHPCTLKLLVSRGREKICPL